MPDQPARPAGPTPLPAIVEVFMEAILMQLGGTSTCTIQRATRLAQRADTLAGMISAGTEGEVR